MAFTFVTDGKADAVWTISHVEIPSFPCPRHLLQRNLKQARRPLAPKPCAARHGLALSDMASTSR
jgi:hypothetical protein